MATPPSSSSPPCLLLCTPSPPSPLFFSGRSYRHSRPRVLFDPRRPALLSPRDSLVDRCSGLLHHDCYRRRHHRLSHLSSDCPTTVPLVVTCAPPPPSSPTPPSPTPKRRPPRIFRQCLSEPGERGRRGARVPTTGGGKVNGIWVD